MDSAIVAMLHETAMLFLCISEDSLALANSNPFILYYHHKILIWWTKFLSFFADDTDCFEGTFRRAIRPFLLVSQIHGVMPLNGIASKSLSDLHFKWRSPRTIYAALVACTLSTYSLLLLCKIFTNPALPNMSRWILYS